MPVRGIGEAPPVGRKGGNMSGLMETLVRRQQAIPAKVMLIAFLVASALVTVLTVLGTSFLLAYPTDAQGLASKAVTLGASPTQVGLPLTPTGTPECGLAWRLVS